MAKDDRPSDFVVKSVWFGLVWYALVVVGSLCVLMSGMLDPIDHFFEVTPGFPDRGARLFWLGDIVGTLPVVLFTTVLIAMLVENRHPLWTRRALLCFVIVWGWLLSTILWICMFPDHFLFYGSTAMGYLFGILGYLVLERLAFKMGSIT